VNYLIWLLKAAIFFTLFAFALNNQQAVAVHFFFGTFWKAPLVLVVLTAFGIGLALGVLLMMPRWWNQRARQAKPPTSQIGTAAETNNPPSVPLESTGSARHGF
jgi:putative membrane protein